MLNFSQFKQFFHRSSLAQSLIHDKLPLTGWVCQKLQQLFLALFVKIFCKTQSVSSDFQTADGLLEGFLVGLADAHYFSDRTHLRTQFVLRILKFLECPSCKLYDNVIAAGHIFVQCSVYTAGNFIQCKSCSQHCGDQGNGKTGCLAGQSRGTWSSGIDFNDNNPVTHRVMSKLYICSANDLYLVHNFISLLLQTLLQLLGDS